MGARARAKPFCAGMATERVLRNPGGRGLLAVAAPGWRAKAMQHEHSQAVDLAELVATFEELADGDH
eukprot:12661168-Heterocapsa_arctica.AAC.1